MNAKQRRKLIRDKKANQYVRARTLVSKFYILEKNNPSVPWNTLLPSWLQGLKDQEIELLAEEDTEGDYAHPYVVVEYKRRLELKAEAALLGQ